MTPQKRKATVHARQRAAERARRQERQNRVVVIAIAAAGVIAVAVVVVLIVAGSGGSKNTPAAPGSARQLSEGQRVFAAHCAQCHGRNLEGGPMAPSAVSHEFASLPDSSYHQAITQGVANKRPSFGPMPPQDITPAEADAVIAYIRGQQRQAGTL